MGLAHALDAFKALLESRLVTAGISDCVVGVGGDSLLDEFAAAAPPRIAIVPGKESWGPAAGRGGDSVTRPAPMATRTCRVLAAIWGDEMADTEAMIDAFAQALNDFGSPYSCAIVDGEWGGEGNLQAGWPYDLTFTVAVPVCRAAEETVTGAAPTLSYEVI